MRGCLHNLETPFQCAKRLRYKVMKHAFTRVRAVYRGHPVSDYTRLDVGITWVSRVEATQINEFGVLSRKSY